MGLILSYKDLDVWKEGVNISTDIYAITKSFPKEEIFGITSQIRRSTISIPLNIAERHGRKSTKSYINFLNIARGSLNELETCLMIAKNLKYISEKEYNTITEKLTIQAKRLSSLVVSLTKKLPESSK
ncbi:MAG: four helix bundle protein [Bacteroidota bacterium]|nr:four helix bundle protein [Bacteroidota bacterium]